MANESADDTILIQPPSLPPSDDAGAAIRSVASLLVLAAHHQAGHAVIAALLGARVLGARLWDGPPPGGEVQIAGLEHDAGVPADHRVVRMLAYYLAGPIAETIAEGGGLSIQGEPGYRAAMAIMDGFRSPASIDDQTDHGAAARLLLDHFGENEAEAAAAADHLSMGVEGWISDQWPAIARVAVRLLRHRHLTADDFRAVVPPLPPIALP